MTPTNVKIWLKPFDTKINCPKLSKPFDTKIMCKYDQNPLTQIFFVNMIKHLHIELGWLKRESTTQIEYPERIPPKFIC